jgi:hypothetical protein
MRKCKSSGSAMFLVPLYLGCAQNTQLGHDVMPDPVQMTYMCSGSGDFRTQASADRRMDTIESNVVLQSVRIY